MNDPQQSGPATDWSRFDGTERFAGSSEKDEKFTGNSPIGYLKRGICEDDILLGNGFLERGSACLLVGLSGIRKSSIANQQGCCWACGVDAFDFRPPRPLRIVMIQNEDSQNDLVRMSEVARHLNLTQAQIDLIDQNY